LLTKINKVLSAEELAPVHDQIRTAKWTSGEQSAGTTAATQKSNLEMDQNTD